MPNAIVLHETGGPEVLKWENVPKPELLPGEVLIRQKAVGLNYIDVYHRSGIYKLPKLPAVPGMEAAGEVEAVGEGVQGFSPGDRVAYGSGPVGAYTELRAVPVRALVKIPDPIPDTIAAAVMLKGLTAHMLLRRVYRVGTMHRVLIHAAAGGVGLILAQWAKAAGSPMVIGTVGSKEKAELALANGCDYAINTAEEDFVAKVKEITEGKGVHVVYDSVGKDTFMKSLDCLTRLGMMVSFGQSSGPVPPFDIGLLRDKGSLFLTRPSLMDYKQDHDEYLHGAVELFDLMLSRKIRVTVGQTYYLKDAAAAHRDLEARKTKGSTVLMV